MTLNQDSENPTNQIAIVGLACRYPGDVLTPTEFWDLLEKGRNGFSPASKRFNADAFYHPSKNKLHTIPTKGAHYLSQDISTFDAAFFNITHAEAMVVDPQQRLALELCFEAFENAGITMEELSGSPTGCFMGCSSYDWHVAQTRDIDSTPRYVGRGAVTELISNRVSWFLNLKGPSMTVSTACSSSLVAMHLGCQSIRAGESTMVAVGGVNMMLGPEAFMHLANQGFLGSDGICKTFDASGDGYGRGEGCGVVILKRLDDALRDGNPIRAIIRGSGCNQDGFTQGISLPSADAQARLIRDVYARAGLSMSETQYVECHGTGTKAGDPIELRAIGETIGQAVAARKGRCLIVGSVKPNIGHLEAGSGIAGVIKGVLALERGLLPPNLYFRKPNPDIHFDAWNLSVPTELAEWPSALVRRMSVNSFGMGGTNAHVILEDGSRYDSTLTPANGDRIGPKDDLDPSPPLLFVLSASDQAGIARSARTLSLQLQGVAEKPTYLGNLAYTLGTGRSRMNWKSFCIASSRAELVKLLDGEDGSSATRSHVPPRIGFVFTGQGAQWARMGIGLARYAIFRNTVDAADTILAGMGCSWRVWDELRAPVGASRIDRPEYSQPICTVLQIALVELLASWNVVPERVVGHSSGEIAAAYCAGVISMRDAIKIAYFRGTVSAHISGKGGMMAVGCSVDEAEDFISQVKTGKLVVSCINSPKNVTVSGDIAGLARLQCMLEEKAVFSRQLKVDNAYHSDHMHQVADLYGETITSINTMSLADHGNYDAPIMVSSVQASMVDGDALGPAYWVRNMVSPVLFDSGVREFVAPASQTREGPEARVKVVDMVVEVGPHPALQSAFTETVETLGVGGILYHAALRRGQDAVASALELAGALYAHGCRIDMAAVNAHDANPKPTTLCDLRPYPWNHTRRYWPESRQTREFVRRDHPRRSLLGAQITQPGVGEHLWRGYLRLSEEPWIHHHNIHSSILYPATAYLVMVIEAARQLADPGKELRAWKLRDIRIPAATVMTESVDVETSVHLRPHLLGTRTSDSGSWWEFSVSTSQDGGELQQKCRGLVSIVYEAANPDEHATRAASEELQSLVTEYESLESAQSAVEITPESFYKATSAAGLLWGDKFRNITRLRVLGDNLHVTAEVTVPEHCESFSTGQAGWTHRIHPTTLDSILQPVCGPLVARGRMRAFVPQCIDELEVSARISSDPGTRLRGYCAVEERGLREVCSDITFFDEQRSFVAVKLRGYSSTEIQDLERDAHDALKDVTRKLCARTAWAPAVDLLTGDEMARLFSTRNQSADDNDSSAAASAVMAVVHCDPSVSILEVADQTSESPLFKALERACPDRPAGSYTIAMPKLHADQTDSDGLCLEKEEGLHVIDLECDDAFPDTRNSKFDIVAISSINLFSPENAEQAGKLLSKLTRALNPRGRIVCEVHRHLDLSMVRRLFSDNGCKCETPNDNTSCLVFSKLPGHGDDAAPQQQQQNLRTVLLLQSTSATEAASGLGSQVASRLREAGLSITARSWDDEFPKADEEDLSSYTECISLLELEHPFLQDISAADYASLKTVLLQIPRLIWVTGIEGPSTELMVGMARTVRNEMPDRRIQTLKLSGQGLSDGQADLVVRLATSPTGDDEFSEQDGVLHVNRVVMDAAQDDRVHEHTYELTKLLPMDETPHPLRLAIHKAGLLDTLYFHPDDRTLQPLGENEVEIEVKASGVNFRDIMCTMGILPDTLLGCEASGIVRRAGTAVTKFRPGDRVCAQTRGAHATAVRAHESMCERLPDRTSFAEGAAIGVVHCTAYHALVNLARLRPGQSVLIHSGAGGVGQAAIQLAQHLRLRIYTTVGSREKRALLRDEYGLRDDQIFSSRDTSFVTGIKRATNNRGVDCVLNSLAGELLRQSFYCLASFGTFVEIGMRDVVGNTRLDMLPFAKQTTFTLINLWAMMTEAPQLMQSIVAETFANLTKGIIRAPVPLTVYPVARHQEAFRLMQAGKHQGKLVLSYEGPNEVPVLRRPRDLLRLDPSATYLLVGGLGGLGRSLASMMASSGARHLAFLSRGGAGSSTAARDTIDKLRADGCTVQVYKADLADRDSLDEALKLCARALPPIRGVVQMAMVLRDGVFANMTHDQWRDATRPKVQGTWNLHEAFPRHHDLDLDFFIILSSCAGVFGNRGQANYAAAGAYQDGLARYRRQLGLKAVSVDLGIMLDVGVLAEKGAAGDLAAMEQHLGIHEYEFHGLMRAVINGQLRNDSATQIITGLATSAIVTKSGMPRPAYLGHPRFSHLALSNGSASQDGPAETVGARLREAKSKDEVAQIITDALIAKVAEILRTPESEIDPARPLYTYGVDSLVAMEVRSWIVREIQVDVSLFEILLAVPMGQFAIGLAERKSIGNERGDGIAK